jgi:hypothetical protein
MKLQLCQVSHYRCELQRIIIRLGRLYLQVIYIPENILDFIFNVIFIICKVLLFNRKFRATHILLGPIMGVVKLTSQITLLILPVLIEVRLLGIYIIQFRMRLIHSHWVTLQILPRVNLD